MLLSRATTITPWLRRSWSLLLAAVLVPSAALTVAGPVQASPPGHSSATAAARSTVANPLIHQNAPDPSVLRAQDGSYYLYSTSTYLTGDPRPHTMPIYRSRDMAHWTYVGDVFKTVPAWITTATGAWAPDVHYMNGRYYLYYSTSQTKALPRYGSPAGAYAIGVATAPTPTGPWTDAGPSAGGDLRTGPVVPPRYGWCTNPDDAGCYDWVIDSHVYQGPDGVRYLYEGSYFGGNRLHRLNPDGLSVVPDSAVQFGHQIRYEASFLYPHLVGRQRMYYMFNSQSNCCEGANTPYSVVVNRGNQPWGNLTSDGGRASFKDQNGLPMEYAYGPPTQFKPGDSPFGSPIWWNLAGEAGGFPVIKANGNGIVGPGHQAVIADLAGQDWLYYHGVEESRPWSVSAGGTEGGLFRQLYLNRLDWTADGWPIVRNGNGPSRAVPTPVTEPELGANFNGAGYAKRGRGAPEYRGAVRAHFRDAGGRWTARGHDPVAGGYLSSRRARGTSVMTSRQGVAYSTSGLHAECDLRLTGTGTGRFGCALQLRDENHRRRGSQVVATVDARTRRLTLTGPDGAGHARTTTGALPAQLDLRQWNHLALELDPNAPGGTTVTATLQNSDRNPMVDVFLDVPDRSYAADAGVSLLTEGVTADFDNVTLTPRTARTAHVAAPPTAGHLSRKMSDEFGGKVGPQWRWLREEPSLHAFAPSGALQLTTNGNLDPYQRLNADRKNPPALPLTKNVLLQQAPKRNFMVETKLHFDPQTDNLSAGLAIYSDDDTHVSNLISWNGVLTQVVSTRSNLSPLPPGAACPLSGPVPGANVAAASYSHSSCPPRSEHSSQEYPAATRCCWDGNGRANDPSRITVLLRLYRHGDVVTPWLSVDGHSWMRENAWTLRPASASFPLQIALYASSNSKANDPAARAQAWFDYVHVYTMR